MEQSIVEQNNEIISVSELNNAAKRLLENNFNNVSVLGEISNLSKPSSGHMYFSLKDESGSIRCAMFRNANSRLQFSPKTYVINIRRGRQKFAYATRFGQPLFVLAWLFYR